MRQYCVTEILRQGGGQAVGLHPTLYCTQPATLIEI